MLTLAAVRELAVELGLPVRDSWLESLCTPQGLPEITPATRQRCFKELMASFLDSDLHDIGATQLPEIEVWQSCSYRGNGFNFFDEIHMSCLNLQAFASQRVPGRFVFQVDEMINIAAPVKQRWEASVQ